MPQKRPQDAWVDMQARLEASWKEITQRADTAVQKAQEIAAQARQRMEHEMDDLRAGRHAVQERMKPIAKTAGQEWKTLRKDLEKAARDLVAASKALQEAAAKAIGPQGAPTKKKGKGTKRTANKAAGPTTRKATTKTAKGPAKKATKKAAKKPAAKTATKRGA